MNIQPGDHQDQAFFSQGFPGPELKSQIRMKIERDVRLFLESDGTITVIAAGMMKKQWCFNPSDTLRF